MSDTPTPGAHRGGAVRGHVSRHPRHRAHRPQDGDVRRGGRRHHGIRHRQDVCRTRVSARIIGLNTTMNFFTIIQIFGAPTSAFTL